MWQKIKNIFHFIVSLFYAIRYGFPSKDLTVIGVTGTDGKTTTTTFVYEILKANKCKVSMISTVNAVIAGKTYDTGFHVTTMHPKDTQRFLREAVKKGDTHVVLEVTSHGLDQYRVFGIRFYIGILTNVTHEHLDYHKTFNNYLKTKVKLLKKATYAVVNRDNNDVYTQIIKYLYPKTPVTYGVRREATISGKSYDISLKIPGEFNTYNALAALSVVHILELNKNVSLKALSRIKGIVGRMEYIQKKPFVVIVDFAHTPNALDHALKTVKEKTKNRIIHVFGSAGLRDQKKRPFMGQVSSNYADMIVLTEEDSRTEDVDVIMDEIASGIKPDIEIVRKKNRRDAIDFALREAKKDDAVIITGKGHEQSLCRGTTEYSWSDRKAVENVLKAM